MKIVVLDGFTLNPGDLDWSPLADLGELVIHDRTSPDLLIERASGAEILFTNKTPLLREHLQQLVRLKYIGMLATGYDIVDITAAREHGVVVTNVPGYGPDSVAQMVFAHILHIVNNVAGHSEDVKSGGWAGQEDFCYSLTPLVELTGKTMGIIGYGEIGKATARLALAYNMRVLVHTRTIPQTLPQKVEHVKLDALLQQSDIITLHCPLTDSTRQMINSDTLVQMKKSSILINCSRGPLVNEEHLSDALNAGQIAAAGLDVLSVEPPTMHNPLFQARNCHITPHIAWATKEARERLFATAVNNLQKFLTGNEQNVVN